MGPSQISVSPSRELRSSGGFALLWTMLAVCGLWFPCGRPPQDAAGRLPPPAFWVNANSVPPGLLQGDSSSQPTHPALDTLLAVVGTIVHGRVHTH